ncbi:hypothetical protein [Paenarthrobacter ilicis]|uniref:hypothetical protein n=1 Tax=Paenarthrobacter ilicis TaxID=43665 RepID=UPI003866B306
MTPGAERNLLYEDGTNKLRGPAESFPVDENTLREMLGPVRRKGVNERGVSPAQAAIVDAVLDIGEAFGKEVLIPYFVEEVKPAIVNRLKKVGDGIRSRSKRASEFADSSSSVVAKEAMLEEACDAEIATFSMAADEYRERLLMALAAEVCAAEERKILSNITIHDGHITPDLRRAIRLVLHEDAENVEQAARDAVTLFLLESRNFDDEYVLIKRKEAAKLSLTQEDGN